ncbi:hypothetical protein FBU59_001753 [Linderina macrospora]|uniref:Uncharacterized protein n=1 Tax=Linderina macrospora TaxID=4868 RepID=A0ACC1JCZ9_9FUNG|nr:hypothetical protein FBU59_001753 [Linderina macrospora]
MADNLVAEIVLDECKERLVDIVSGDPQKLIEQLEDAARHIHSIGIVHGDINPNNAIAQDGNLVLIDFDGCGEYSVKIGTAGFMSPDYAKTEACDWYSVEEVNEYILKKIRNTSDEQNSDQAQQDRTEP